MFKFSKKKNLRYISENVELYLAKKILLPPLQERRKKYWCGERYVKVKTIPTWEDYVKGQLALKKELPQNSLETIKHELNKKVAVWNGDSTTLEIGSIVNAAKRSLKGGGGIDGAIHRSAGGKFYKECCSLHGCNTGETKITLGYNLPAKFVLHTVGPQGYKPKLLTSCYRTLLDLMVECKIRTVGICGISTGIYGFPLNPAVNIALKTTRDWLLEDNHLDLVDKIVFVTFLKREAKAYENYMYKYFPCDFDQLREEIKSEKYEKKKRNTKSKKKVTKRNQNIIIKETEKSENKRNKTQKQIKEKKERKCETQKK
ncbi:adp-ribose glycohydrolase macrod2 [Anaeramoeba flamelloides]|uniref:Adp-ribose glycohydrolase macrod2 n=1 Tax=Anaeramoeba flamelloides TaxID=1746091 RepID=A0ABQ8XY39_9EUKA|nr:adp-ribose glycohydrolase macrod2 [Anaeramoeba flamelloides]